MGTSSHSNKGGIPKGIGLEGNEGNLSSKDISEDNILNMPELSSVKTLDQLLDEIKKSLEDDEKAKRFKGKKLHLPKDAVKDIFDSFNNKTRMTGQLISKIRENGKKTGDGISGLGGLAGGLTSIGGSSIMSFEDIADDLDLNKNEREIINPAIAEAQALEKNISLDEEEKTYMNPSSIATLAAIKYSLVVEKLKRVGADFDQTTKYRFVAEAKEELKRSISISPNDFNLKELSDFLGAKNG